MKPKKLIQVIFVVALALLLGSIGCSKTKSTKGVMVINNCDARMVTMKVSDKGELPNPWDPGWVVLFRTDGKIPGGEAGKAGQAYIIDESKRLSRIGTFDLSKSDDELAKDY